MKPNFTSIPSRSRPRLFLGCLVRPSAWSPRASTARSPTVPASSGPGREMMTDHGVVCSMSRSGNVWDNAAMESFFSSLKTDRTARKMYRTRNEAKADVFDYIECFYNPKRGHSTIGYLSPVEFEKQMKLA